MNYKSTVRKAISLLLLIGLLSSCEHTVNPNEDREHMTFEQNRLLYDGQPFNGEWNSHYEDGYLKETGSYKDGFKEGMFKEYYAGGVLKTIAEYSAGQMNGSFKKYYSDGQFWINGTYSNGLRDGEFKYLNKKGELVETRFYRNGVRID